MKRNILNSMIIIAALAAFGISANAQTAKCTGSQLALKEGESEGDMGGKTYGKYIFTNISSTPCTMIGFPKFVLLDKAGKVMPGVKVTHDPAPNDSGDEKPALVTLAPKETAWFQTFWQNGFGYDLKRPLPSSAESKITAPGTTRVFTLKDKINANKFLQVSAIKKGMPD